MLSKLKLHGRTIQQDSQHTPWHELWRQPLALLIRMPWALFFLAMGLVYLAVILIFTAVLSFDQQHLIGKATMGMPRPFVFAVEAFFANGFNGIFPDSVFTYLVGVVDMVAGLITLSSLTAVIFTRLSSNDMPLRFSRHLCLSSLNEGHLFCRFVTSDPSQWLNVSYSLTLILDDEVEPGVWQRRTRSLALLNGGTPQLSQTATLTHPLDANSPIQQLGLEELKRRNAVLMPLVEGVDEITGAGLLQTHLYRMGDVLSGRRFGDLVSQDPQGRKRVDIHRLNQVVPT
uniref:hypothetical protein n=1 Tax=Cyanobium sp. TaxID=2164130 RepID=UPI0040474008